MSYKLRESKRAVKERLEKNQKEIQSVIYSVVNFYIQQ